MIYYYHMRPGSAAFHYRFNNPFSGLNVYYHKQAPNWSGKLLVRKEHQALPNWSNADIIYENSIPGRYSVVGPMQESAGYDPNRLLVYVNSQNIIETVRYG